MAILKNSVQNFHTIIFASSLLKAFKDVGNNIHCPSVSYGVISFSFTNYTSISNGHGKSFPNKSVLSLAQYRPKICYKVYQRSTKQDVVT